MLRDPMPFLRCLALVALAAAPLSAHAQVPPDVRWQTLGTPHFRITFSPGLEPVARHVAERAEAARALLEEAFAPPPRGIIDIVVSDHVDFANGFATPFPSNRITLYARPPVDHLALSFTRDWIDMLVIHELTHIFHLDRAGLPGSVLRRVFGRAPILWPIFPAVGTPQWSIEGLATHFESRMTGAGRTYGSIHEMIVRTDVLEGRFEPIDKASGYSPEWPGSQRWYVYGSLFYDHITRTRGIEAQRELAARTARALVPPVLAFDRVARRAVGTRFSELWDEWREQLELKYARLADSLRAEGLTAGEALTDDGRYALHARVAPDGRVAYAVQDGRSDPATRLLEPETGRSRVIGRRNGLATLAWFPGGDSLLVAQHEFSGRYAIYGDLFVVRANGSERRLTKGARLTEPDVAPDGARAVAVQTHAGATRLVTVALGSGSIEPITEYDIAVNWSAPRWAPSGERIAVARWRLGGEYDIVILDPAGRLLHELTRDRAIDAAPAWSPDGRYILFWSDRSGIPNLYAFDHAALETPDAESRPLRQVTNTLTGALYPDVSPDGRWIYYSGYRSDGYRIERLRFEPERWRPAPPLRPELVAGAGTPGGPGGPPAPGSGAVRAAEPLDPDGALEPPYEVRPYSAAHTLLPRFWLPTVVDAGAAGRFFGAFTFSEDLVGRHTYNAWAAVDPNASRLQGALLYRYAGLGEPVLDFEVSRDWDRVGRVRLEDGSTRDVVERESVLGLGTSFVRRRWRSFVSFGVGGEQVWRHREIIDAPGLRLADPRDALTGLVARASFGTARSHAFSISREAGFSAAVAGRHRWDRDPAPDSDRSYSEATAWLAAYRALPAFGFANHVLAARASTLWRNGAGAGLSDIGGASGEPVSLGFATLGEGLFLPVRGFDKGARAGSRAWTASLEYRLPIALIGRGYRTWPFNLDRVSAALFLDAGNAWCSPVLQDRSSLCPAPSSGPVAGPLDPAPLVGAGAELALDLSLLFATPTRLRAGIGVPLHGPGNSPVFHLRFGPTF